MKKSQFKKLILRNEKVEVTVIKCDKCHGIAIGCTECKGLGAKLNVSTNR